MSGQRMRLARVSSPTKPGVLVSIDLVGIYAPGAALRAQGVGRGVDLRRRRNLVWRRLWNCETSVLPSARSR
jgi:hypothetical protein